MVMWSLGRKELGSERHIHMIGCQKPNCFPLRASANFEISVATYVAIRTSDGQLDGEDTVTASTIQIA